MRTLRSILSLRYARLSFPFHHTVKIRMIHTQYATEKLVAMSAVRRACLVTEKVFQTLVKNESFTKGDRTPVTIGDYAAQAVISVILHSAFPEDNIVGEEDTLELRKENNREMLERIVGLTNEALNKELVSYEKGPEWGIGNKEKTWTEKDILDAIDLGSYPGGRQGRMWTIDPIDGTKGFLRGEQYAVCVALLVDGVVQLGIIGCPNLGSKSGEKGLMFVAVRHQGAEKRTIDGAHPTTISMPNFEPEDLAFLESVEKAHASLDFNASVAKELNVRPSPIRMDSQAKYGVLAMGNGGAYLRLPADPEYEEKIWDHAPGSLLVEEAGGTITDSRGKKLDFGLGRTLGRNYGVVAAGKEVHPVLLSAIQRVKRDIEEPNARST